MKWLLNLLPLVLLVMLAAPVLAPYDPTRQDRDAVEAAPSSLHWFGTDDYGRDLWSRFLFGARWSVSAGLGATALVLALGWTLGGTAGFLGGWIDHVLMQAADVFLVVPWLYLLIGARAALPLNLSPRLAFAALLLVIAGVSWARPARLVRGLVWSLATRGYVEAARSFGVPRWRVFGRHILPGTLGLLLTQTLVLLPRFVLAEVTLAYLGLGSGEPEPSWGGLILPLKQAYLLPAQWWRALPTLLMLPFFALCALAAHHAEKRFTLR